MKTLVAFIVGLIAAPLLLALVGLLGWLPSKSTSNPPKWEMDLGMRWLDASLEKRSAGFKNPIAANDKSALAAGQKLYGQNCASCHGDAKAPSAWGSKGFYPRVPQFFQEGTDVGPEEAYTVIHDGVRYTGMGAWKGKMTDQQTWQVANFVARIRAPGGTHDMDMH